MSIPALSQSALFQARRGDGSVLGDATTYVPGAKDSEGNSIEVSLGSLYSSDISARRGYANPIAGILGAIPDLGNGIPGSGLLGETSAILVIIPDVNILDAVIGAQIDTAVSEVQDLLGIYNSDVSAMIVNMDRNFAYLSTYGAAAAQLPDVLEACGVKSSRLFGPILQAGQDLLAEVRRVIGLIRDAIAAGIDFLRAQIANLLGLLNQAKTKINELLADARKALDEMLKDVFDWLDSTKLPSLFQDDCIKVVLDAVLSPTTLAAVAETVNPGSQVPI